MSTATVVDVRIDTKHLEDLYRSGLSDDMIRRIGFRSLSKAELVPTLGRRLAGQVHGALEIPYPGMTGDQRAPFSRYKLFPPVRDPYGHKQRYFQTRKTAPRLFVPPGTEGALLARQNPLMITEGEKKAAKASQDGRACMAIGGLWSWWCRAGHALPEFDLIDWVGRPCLIVPDSGVWAREDLLHAIYALAKELEGRGSRVAVTKLPPASGGAEGKLDDFLVTNGVEALDMLPRVPISDSAFRGCAAWRKGWVKKRADDRGRAPGDRRTPAPSAATRGYRDARNGSPVAPIPAAFTDVGNAKRFAIRHGGDVRYCHPLKSWFVWDETRWRADDGPKAMGLAKATAQNISEEAHAGERIGDQWRTEHWALKSQSRARLDAMLYLAQSETGIPVDVREFDRDGWLLNCANGTVDLRKGALIEHRREDLITKTISVEYCPGASCPRFDKFLQLVFAGDSELIAFVQRAAGYSLTGDTGEQVFFLCEGPGANGKSTLVNTISAILGAYAGTVSMDTFFAKREEALGLNDLARLAGVRFASAVESDMGQRLNEAMIKRLTGGEEVPAKLLYANRFTFPAIFKLWLATNHRPIIRHGDEAMWRRILVIPFRTTITKRDPSFADKLKKEYPGILAWLVRGSQAWQERGLDPPEVVRRAINGYRAEMDTIGVFLTERCVLAAGARVTATALYDAYTEWTREAGEPYLSQTALGRGLSNRGLTSWKRGNRRGWNGIGLQR